MTRKNISQPDEAWEAWDRAAAKLDKTLSQLIFEAMNDHLGLLLLSVVFFVLAQGDLRWVITNGKLGRLNWLAERMLLSTRSMKGRMRSDTPDE